MTTLVLILMVYNQPPLAVKIEGFPSANECTVEGMRWERDRTDRFYFCASTSTKEERRMTRAEWESASKTAAEETDAELCLDGQANGDYFKQKYFCKPKGQDKK